MIKPGASNRRNRRVRYLLAVLLMGGLLIQYQRASVNHQDQATKVVIQGPSRPSPNQAFASYAPLRSRSPETLEQRAARDPMGFFEEVLDGYDRRVRDYSCTFTKQELVGGKLTAEQVIDTMFREKPFSVRFEWVKNEDKCSRALYVEDRWTEGKEPMAVIEPGPIARLFVKYVMRPIHGQEALKSSRRTIDQFGMRNATDLVLKYCRLAEKRAERDFSFAYKGNGQVNKRETLVFERVLPYTGEKGPWPDRLLVVHVDRELMLPTLCECYADTEKKILLGKYLYTDVKLNVNHPDSVFTKAGMGL